MRVIVMCGLPARGKTYTARKIARYLRWNGQDARVFNVGNYRRSELGVRQPASFFDPTNPEGAAARAQVAKQALEDMLGWLDRGGEVAIYDATNVTRARRALVAQACRARGHDPVFVEQVCTDPAVVEANVRETKLLSPDYAGVPPDEAVADFRRRIHFYEAAWEPLSEAEDLPFVKVIDVGARLEVQGVRGHLASRLVFFLMNLHLVPRTLYLMRHGESLFNLEARIGGDPELSAGGSAFARSLAAWLRPRLGDRPEVWTSTLRRTRATAQPPLAAGGPSRSWRALDEIDAGAFDGLTYREVAAKHPEEWRARKADKLTYRYPRGESYRDVMGRLDPVILELESRRDPVVVIAHNAVIRCLYAWFTELPPERAPHLEIPLHTVLALTPKAYGVAEERTWLGPLVQAPESAP
jgi:broad specificity phosphatase PhoE/predicted kinase